MDAIEAYKKVLRRVPKKDIDYLVNVNNGWVVLGKELSQPLYMDDNVFRGLSPSIQKDNEILVIANKKIKDGDFY